jgi:predicted DNA-binding transcriptional regulator YafY
MTTIKTTIRNRRIEVPAPCEIPDGTEVILTIQASAALENEPLAPEEIARVLAAMQKLEPLEIPDDVAADLDAWERKINQHGIEHKDESVGDVFR